MHFPEWFSLLFIGLALLMGIIIPLEKLKKNEALRQLIVTTLESKYFSNSHQKIIIQ